MNTTPITDLDSLNFKELTKQALDVARSVPNWKLTKTYSQSNVITDVFSSTIEQDFWVARQTQLNAHQTSSYEDKFHKLLIGNIPIDLQDNHTFHEKNYIHDLYDFNIKGFNDSTYLIKTFYNLPFPLKKRTFHNLVHIVDTGTYSMVLSLSLEPGILGIDPGFVVGHYSSIELIERNEKGLLWTMCTSSNPNGSIPYWITKKSLPGAIVNDVPSFLAYCDKH
ncbi:hypothetical protein PSN45_001201 [Yamadazyma tenuis]|uniref:DUF3074 domain-containing protein n=1 Tax=Candida tenuis (strain ATCC 10573 / BCRC 21748 / CBS 615 / JCM 9827 / NBRC 10315 / NRRL Y-1498 / VKM Y-70) TaxID=590646 RepID=G3B925_CANTC|nr:uncharacterized protein CANTEDRAFT_115908 [Yamadazyma tenuis ATCC 10573]EGV62445.1 hypothetical protein CANTEDRAFT_115908 [Yamadazyma tenuis ATCC 10573]WEJ93729.1 hypothetical protein PSN45_001201 [Yamadazyma tenuis]